jgi:hypothetical protein
MKTWLLEEIEKHKTSYKETTYDVLVQYYDLCLKFKKEQDVSKIVKQNYIGNSSMILKQEMNFAMNLCGL